jgi:methylenetetrahydrofolate dehydrogenase (NADP+)/methenyltetrahydrofolate cyclohydrolase
MAIAAEKDIDGFHPTNQWNTILWGNVLFTPCTPWGIMEIFQREKIELEWKIVTIIGRSNIVGKPITNLLMNAWATVINCNKETPEDFLWERTKESDIVIVAAGVPHLLKADMINNKTIVIDVWITKKEDGKLYGDADFDNIISQWNHITPVPGWVWPMTVAMLMRNTLKAYQEQNKK